MSFKDFLFLSLRNRKFKNRYSTIKQVILISIFFLLVQRVTAQKQLTAQDSIPFFFNEIKAATQKNYNLWNRDLYGAMLLIDPDTREIFANQPDSGNFLKPKGSIYSGILPNNMNMANTSINWSGKRWAMIILPLPTNSQDRINLLAHELFHKAQPSLHFTFHNPQNNHLNEMGGRIYLRLELEALEKALLSSSQKEIQQHLTNALTFRKYRYTLYPGADTTENLLELNEGLAEFTGAIISGRNKKQATEHFITRTNSFFTSPTFVRSFAYYTTPAYGYLLYNINKNWNKKITSKTDLTNYFIKAFHIKIPTNLKETAERISQNYNGKKILQEEAIRDAKTKKLIAEYKHKFIEQPHFVIPFEKMDVSFDPRNILPIEDKGTVYPEIRVTDLWGILTAEHGAFMSPDWTKITVTAPTQINDKKIVGDGWTLELTNGYTIEKDAASGNYNLVKNKN